MIGKLTSSIARTFALVLTICATGGASAAVKPLAVWNGDFKNGDKRGVITFSDGGNTIDSGILKFVSGKYGASFTPDSTQVSLSAAFTLSNVSASGFRILGTFQSEKSNTYYDDKFSICIKDGNRLMGAYDKGTSSWGTSSMAWSAHTTELKGYGVAYSCSDSSARPGTSGSFDGSTFRSYNNTSAYILRNGGENPSKVTLGGYTSSTSYTLEGAQLSYVAILPSTSQDDIDAWSLTGMTKAAATFVGSDANTGVNIPASGETISAATTAAAVFVQDDARLTFTGSGALTIGGGTGPLYVADGKTLTLDLSGAKAPTIDTPVVKVVSGTLFGKSQVSVSAVPTAANGFIDYKIADDGVYLYYSPKTASFALGIDDGVNGTYVTTSTQTAFTGITLQEFYDGGYEIKGRFAGGSINDRGVVVTGYNPVVTKDGSGNVTAIRYEMQGKNNEVKCVVITLTPNAGNTGIDVVATPVNVAGSTSAALYAASSWPIGNAFLSGDNAVTGVSKGTFGSSYSAYNSYCLYYLHIVGKFDKEVTLAENSNLAVGTDLATAYNSLTVSGTGRLTITGRCSTDGVSVGSGATLEHSGATVIGGDISLANGAKLAIAAGSNASINFGMAISGGGAVDVESGCVTLNRKNGSLTGDITIKSGAKLIADIYAESLGAEYDASSCDRRIIVEDGGTVDINGFERSLLFKIAGDGVDNNGALVNNGASTNKEHIQVYGIEISDDASVGGSGDFGIIRSGYGAAKIKFLSANKTLTKKGTGKFWWAAVTGDLTAGGNVGTFNVSEGELYIRCNAVDISSSVRLKFSGGTLTGDANLTAGTVDIESGTPCNGFTRNLTIATLNVYGGGFARNNTTSLTTLNVNNGGSATLNSYVKPTAATVAAGGSITAAKWGSGGIEFSTTLTGAGLLQFQGDNGCTISLTDVSGFTGSVTNDVNLGVRLGASTGDVDNGCILLNSSAEQTIDASKTWSAKTGIMVNSALSNSGTIACPTLTVNGALTNNGTVNADTLDANGTVTATTQIGAEALNVGASSVVTGSYNGGGSGTLTLNGVVAGASFTGYSNLIINDGVTQATTLGFTPTLLTLNGSGSYQTAAGTEGSVLFGQNATGALTLTVDDETVNYNGYTPAVYGSGAVTYSCTGSEGSNITTSGYALLPYYSVWTPQSGAGETGDGAWWKNTTAPAENKNVAFGVAGGATITVNTTIAYGEAQVYGNGSGTFIKSGDNTISFTKLSIISGATLTLTGTSGITASAIYVEEGSTLILDGYTPTCNITGGGTVKLAGTISLSTAISVDPTIEVEGTATLNATVALTIKDTIVVKNGGSLTVSGTITGTPVGGAISVVAGGTLNTSNLTATGGIVMAGSMASTGTLNVTELVVMGTANLTGATITSTKATGTGTVVFVGQRSIPDLKWSDAGWHGTVWFDTVTDQWADFCPTNYCNNSSTIKFSDVKLYFANQTLTAGILELSNSRFNGTTAGHALWVSQGFKASTITFQTLTGGGKFYSGTGAAPVIVFNTVSGFTGNIEIGGSVRLRIGTGNDSVDNGHIVITSGATETIPTGATWQTKYGIDVKGGLKFAGTGTAAVTDSSSSVATYSGSTLDFSEASAGSRISGVLNLASGTTIKLPASATLPYQIATAGNGGLIDDVTVQIGDGTPVIGTVALSGGTISVLAPVNIDTDKTYTVSDVFGTPSAASSYEINVTSDATLTVPDTAVGTILYNFTANGNTITLADGYKIPAAAQYLKITDASTLAAGNYTLFQWTTPQQNISGYGRFASVDTTGLNASLTAEVVYGAKAIYLRVYDKTAFDARPAFKVWAYGDSITEGWNSGNTRANYRVLLAQKLAMRGYNVEMVGCFGQIQLGNSSNSAKGAAFDPSGEEAPDKWQWHSAKHGATLGITSVTSYERAALIENVDTLCAQVDTPDVVLLHGGINDLSVDGVTEQATFDNWSNTVWRILTDLPNTKVVVSTALFAKEGQANYNRVTPKVPVFNNLIKQQLGLVEGFTPERPFPAGRVVLADLNTCVHSADTGILTSDNLHPDWWGHDQMAEGWLEKIVELYPDVNGTFPSSTTKTAPTSEELGAANKTELDSYRAGFTLCRTITAEDNISTSNPYTSVGEGVTANISKVGYFVEYVRKDNNATHWVWVDMDAFGDKSLASIGLPAANRQQVVTRLHVISSHNAIDTVAADDDSVTGWIEFSNKNYTQGASGVSGAPTAHGGNDKSMYDWNDTLGNSGTYSCMQVFRKSPPNGRPAQTLFAYNNWQSSSSSAEFGIGNCAQHFWGGAQTLDYTFTTGLTKLDGSAYSVKTIEIWTKPVYTATMSSTGDFSGLVFSPTLPGDISACDLIINVTANATLTSVSTIEAGSITLNISEGATLTLDANAVISEVTGAGTLEIAAGRTVTVPKGKTLTLAKGAIVNGTLTNLGSLVETGNGLKFYGSGVVTQCVAGAVNHDTEVHGSLSVVFSGADAKFGSGSISMYDTATLTFDPGAGNTNTMSYGLATATTNNKVIVKSGTLHPTITFDDAQNSKAFNSAEIVIENGGELLLDKKDTTGYNRCDAPICVKTGGVLNIAYRETMAHDLYLEGGVLKITGEQQDRGLDLFSGLCTIYATENSTIEATGDYPIYVRDNDATNNVAEGKTLICNCAFVYHVKGDDPTHANSTSDIIKTGAGTLVLNGQSGNSFALPKGLVVNEGTVEVNTTLQSNGQTGDAANYYTVASGAKLKVGNSGHIAAATLTLNNGSLLEFGGVGNTSTAFIEVGTAEFASGTTTVSFSSGVTPMVGAKLISWTGKPAGAFSLAAPLAASYALVSEATGLSIARGVAVVNGTAYATLQAAIAASAGSGQTITLLRDIVYAPSGSVEIGNLNIGNYTLTLTTCAADQVISVTNLAGTGSVIVKSSVNENPGVGRVAFTGENTGFTGSITVDVGGTLVAESAAPWKASSTPSEGMARVTVNGTLMLTHGAYMHDIVLRQVTWGASSRLELVDSVEADGSITVSNDYASGGPANWAVVDIYRVALGGVTQTRNADNTDTYTYKPHISGSACLLDFTFTNTVRVVSGTYRIYAASTSQLKDPVKYSLKTDWDNGEKSIADFLRPDTGTTNGEGWQTGREMWPVYTNNIGTVEEPLYTALHGLIRPFRGTDDNQKPVYFLPNNRPCSAFVAGTIPSAPHTCFVSFGSTQGGIFLATGDTSDEVDLIYVKSTDVPYNEKVHFRREHCTKLTTMRVPYGDAAQHTVVFETSDHQTYDIYLDGELWTRYSFPARIEIQHGFHIGSWIGGDNEAERYYRKLDVDTAPNSYVSAIRIYDTALGANAIAALAEEFPYVSPGVGYERILTDSDEAVETWSQENAWRNVAESEEFTKTVPADMSSLVTITNDSVVAKIIEVNLDRTQKIESLTVSGAKSVHFKKGTGLVAIYGKVTINTDVYNEYGALDMFGVPLEIANGKHLTLDLTNMPIDDYYEVTHIRISGYSTEPVNPEATTHEEKAGWPLIPLFPRTKRYDFDVEYNMTDHSYYLVLYPNHTHVDDVQGNPSGFISVLDTKEAVLTQLTGRDYVLPAAVNKVSVEYGKYDITTVFDGGDVGGQFFITNIVDGKVHPTLNPEASIVIDGQTISVSPVVAAVRVDGNDVAAMADGDNESVVFGVKTIPGLWYAVATSEPGKDFTVDYNSVRQSTGTALKLESDELRKPQKIRLFRILASESKAELGTAKAVSDVLSYVNYTDYQGLNAHGMDIDEGAVAGFGPVVYGLKVAGSEDGDFFDDTFRSLTFNLNGKATDKVYALKNADGFTVATATSASGSVTFSLGPNAIANGTLYLVAPETMLETVGVASYKWNGQETATTVDQAAHIPLVMLANTPAKDGLKSVNTVLDANSDINTSKRNVGSVYRIPAIANNGTNIVAMFDCRYLNHNDLGTTWAGNSRAIDQAICESADSGLTWTSPTIAIDVPNYNNGDTGVALRECDFGDPCLGFFNHKFYVMAQTGVGLQGSDTNDNDLVMYSRDEEVGSAWGNRTSVQAAIMSALETARVGDAAYPETRGILQGPGHAIVWDNKLHFPMQYFPQTGSGNPRVFVASLASDGTWTATKLTAGTEDAEEPSLAVLDNGDWYMIAKDGAGGSTGGRHVFVSKDKVSWTKVAKQFVGETPPVQGSMLKVGAKNGHGVYVAAMDTGSRTGDGTNDGRSDLKLFIGTDASSSDSNRTYDESSVPITWTQKKDAIMIYNGYTEGQGYNSIVQIDATTIGVLFEAAKHIYFKKVDISAYVGGN